MKKEKVLTPLLYKVLLLKKGTGVIAYETIARDDVNAVKQAMDTAFKDFPDAKFALFGIEKSDGDTTISTTRYLGKV